MKPSDEVPDWYYTTDIRSYIDYSAPVVDETEPLVRTLVALGRSNQNAVLVRKVGSRHLLGIITVHDLTKLEGKTDLSSVQAKDLATITGVVGIRHDAKLWQLLRLMNGDNSRKRPFDRIPALDEQKQIVGLISREELDRRLLEGSP